MPKIFISYRRTDSQTFTDRIYDRLAAAFGESSVFQDVDSIRMGADFRVVLREAVESCDVVLVMIGSQWATVTDAQGRKRLFSTADFVRIEVESALNSQKVIIPVIIEGAAMPNPEDLPPSMHELLFRNAAKIRHNPDFNRDMQRLIDQIERHAEELTQQRAAEDAERQRQAEIEAQAKAQAEEREHRRLADEQALLKAVADEQERQRKAKLQAEAAEKARRTELEAAERQRPVQTATTTPPQPAPEPVRPAPRPEPETYTSPALIQLELRRFLKRRGLLRLLVAAGLIVLSVVVGVVVIPIIQKSIGGSTGIIGITRNADWTPVEQDVNGVTMVQVPAGCFDMGNDPQAYYWNDTEWVQGVAAGGHICFDTAFWLDKTEVTNAQFAQFSGKAANASNWTDANRPRESITWFEARDFCALRGGRLPTEAEWEYAARGPDNLTYPWGNDFVADKVVYSGNSNNQTADVGSKAAGAAWVGALDMSGNVWEWVSTLYQPYPYPTPSSSTELQQWINSNDTSNSRILRGGSWSNDFGFTVDLRAAHRGRNGPDNWYSLLGLRCVVSAPIS